MHKNLTAICVCVLLYSCSEDSASSTSEFTGEPRPFSSAELTALVETTRLEFGLPALGVLIQTSDATPLIAVAGLRHHGSDEPVTASDMWFIGSTAKSMTATLMATYVQDGRVEFSTPLVDIFPDYAGQFTDQTRTVTIAHLLSHSAGLPPNPAESSKQLTRLIGDTQHPGEQRRKVLEKAISAKLLFPPGSDHSYSNTGYILIAAVIERLAGKDFETLLAERVLLPLGISRFGFGHPGSADTTASIDQPWGHRPSLFRLVPVAPDDSEHVNPALFNSAGNLHISLENWWIFVKDQINGQAGSGALLDRNLYERLQLPADGNTGYSLGWGVLVEEGEPVMLAHNGSDGSWFADVRAYPPTDMTLLVVTNDGREDDEAKAAAAYIRKQFSRRYAPAP